MSTKSWMERKKITLNKPMVDGKPVTEQVTVAQFVEMYNVQNQVFTKTTRYAQMLLGQLYLVNPDNPFFKTCGDVILNFSKEHAVRIKEKPEIGVLPEIKKEEVPEVTPETTPPPATENIVKADFEGKETQQEETF